MNVKQTNPGFEASALVSATSMLGSGAARYVVAGA